MQTAGLTFACSHGVKSAATWRRQCNFPEKSNPANGSNMPRPILVLGLCLLAARVAGADPVTLRGTGTLESVCGRCFQNVLGSTPAVGDPFSFELTFGDVSGDQFPSDLIGVYSLGAGRS